MHQLVPMLEQLDARHACTPREVLVDGGFASLDAIEAVERRGCRVYAPPMKPRDSERNPYRPLEDDSPQIARWRMRMGTARAKQKYKDRAATAECVNAQARNRGLLRLLVRGRKKARSVLLLYALAHNAMRGVALKQAAAEAPA
jgi:IS5 family transposase